ncbi:Rv1733c family protein [Streptomyces beihaiensis]|uniref:Proline rich protein membrane protein n=1 Tax=Streptomyces beihaiensis TaxID=2984495 RepID=A0ABT3TXE5_9ACTN|nr:hypothetical protein [Streptomyces beihaiensis]MCX3061721.1 hypothetical protein [Streptomyces beihaiensis]
MTWATPSTVEQPLLWRWRHNALRRHSDVVEAWIVLSVWLLAVVFGVVAGVVAARATVSGYATANARAHSVSAVLTGDATTSPLARDPELGGKVWAPVRWTDPNGTPRTDRARVSPGTRSGSHVTVWTDRAGHVVSAPVSGSASAVQAVMTGTLVAPLAGASVWAVGWVVRAGLMRRRLDEWDAEWKLVGPRWTA